MTYLVGVHLAVINTESDDAVNSAPLIVPHPTPTQIEETRTLCALLEIPEDRVSVTVLDLTMTMT